MTSAEQAQIERINQISAIARTSWLALLGYLAFIGVTLLGVEDADFFVPSRQTDLPLVGVHIPTASFFLFAPVLGAALYIYLHIHLLKLWDAIADAPKTLDGQPLGEHLHPWIANDFALALKGDSALRPRPLHWLGNLATRLLVWVAGPAVLTGFWWRSMPAHDEWLTLAIAAALLLTLHAGFASWWSARAWLRHPWLRENPWRRWWRRPLAVLLTLLVVTASWLRTEAGFDHTASQLVDLYDATFGSAAAEPIDAEALEAWIADAWFIPDLGTFTYDQNTPLIGRWIEQDSTWSPLARTNLAGVEMVDLPPDWRSPETAREAFRKVWCDRAGLAMTVCGPPAAAYASPSAPLEDDRASWCGAHPEFKNDPSACTAYFTDLDARFASAWDEERGATLGNLAKLDLSGRDLRGASASGVTLTEADLSAARLDWADLWEARLEGADLSEARLEGADLSGARLEGADLSGARLERAVLTEARLEGAVLYWARLEGAVLSGARLEGADLSGARLERAVLTEARLEGAVLYRARLEGAVLSGARLEGANLDFADFRNSSWAGASNRASPAWGSDLRGAQDLTQAQLEDLIGGADTLLPEGVSDTGEPWYIWSCWETPPEGFDALVNRIVNTEFIADSQDLRDEFLCGPGNPRHKTGKSLPLDAPRPEGHPLAYRD